MKYILIRFWKLDPFFSSNFCFKKVIFLHESSLHVSSKKIWNDSNIDYLPDFFQKILETFRKRKFFTFFSFFFIFYYFLFIWGWDFRPHYGYKFGLNIPKMGIFPYELYYLHERYQKLLLLIIYLLPYHNFHTSVICYIFQQFATPILTPKFSQMLLKSDFFSTWMNDNIT